MGPDSCSWTAIGHLQNIGTGIWGPRYDLEESNSHFYKQDWTKKREQEDETPPLPLR